MNVSPFVVPNDAILEAATAAVPVWEQRVEAGESDARYAWFHCYLMMGPRRSLAGAYDSYLREAQKGTKKHTQAPGSWKEAAKRWNWKERGEAWDGEQRRKSRELAEQLRQERIRATMNEGYEGAAEMVARGRKLLKMPYTESSTMDGQTIIRAANHNYFNVGGRLIKDGTATRRESLDMGKDRELDLDRERLQDEAEELTPTRKRAQENEILDLLQAAVLGELRQGVPGATERMLRIIARRAALNGLDKPFDASRESTPKKRHDLSRYSAAELALLEEMFGGEEA